MIAPKRETGTLRLCAVNVPTSSKVQSPLVILRVKLVDPAVTLDQLDKWAKFYEEVVLKQVIR